MPTRTSLDDLLKRTTERTGEYVHKVAYDEAERLIERLEGLEGKNHAI